MLFLKLPTGGAGHTSSRTHCYGEVRLSFWARLDWGLFLLWERVGSVEGRTFELENDR